MYDRSLKARYSLKAAIDRDVLEPATSLKLFDNTVKQVCLYGAEIWGNFEMDKSSCASDFMGNYIMKFPVEKNKFIFL